jgi:6-pyruvoyltetrahydropterin/6-carboxytetrahydropterin synthase
MRIVKTFTFEAAHVLPFHQGKCKNHHGHGYRLEVEIEGPIIHNKDTPLNGMVMDFGDLKEMVEEVVVERLDHTHLNELLENPTAENIAVWIFWNIASYFDDVPNPKLKRIRLWETPTSYVEASYEDIQHILEHQRGM